VEFKLAVINSLDIYNRQNLSDLDAAFFVDGKNTDVDFLSLRYNVKLIPYSEETVCHSENIYKSVNGREFTLKIQYINSLGSLIDNQWNEELVICYDQNLVSYQLKCLLVSKALLNNIFVFYISDSHIFLISPNGKTIIGDVNFYNSREFIIESKAFEQKKLSSIEKIRSIK